MWKDFVDEMARRTKAHARILMILAGIMLVLLGASAIVHADNVTLGFGECTDIVDTSNNTMHVCAPEFPVINDTVNLTYGQSYINPQYELTVNAPGQNNCTVNVTVVNVTNVTTTSCLLMNQTINLTLGQSYLCQQENVTVNAPQANTTNSTWNVEVNIGYDEVRSWRNLNSIIVHGPASCPGVTTCPTCANVTPVSRQLGYEEYFHTDQVGCKIELFGPPLPNMSCPSIPTCPTLPDIKCPTCPTSTITREVKVDTCPRPESETNCTMSIQVEGKQYCKDSLDSWCQYQVNTTTFNTQSQLTDCTARNVALQATIEYIKSNSELVNTVLIIIGLGVLGAIAKIVYEKLQRGGGPVAERKPEDVVKIMKASEIPQDMIPSEENPPISAKKPAKGSKKR